MTAQLFSEVDAARPTTIAILAVLRRWAQARVFMGVKDGRRHPPHRLGSSEGGGAVRGRGFRYLNIFRLAKTSLALRS